MSTFAIFRASGSRRQVPPNLKMSKLFKSSIKSKLLLFAKAECEFQHEDSV